MIYLSRFLTQHYWKLVAATLLALALILWNLKATEMKFSNFILTTPSGVSKPTKFPFFADSFEGGVYHLKGELSIADVTDRNVRIIPDDEILSLKINDNLVNLNNIAVEQRRDYSIGFNIDLSAYLHTGSNAIEINYSDAGGKMGILMAPSNSTAHHQLLFKLLTLVGVSLFLLALTKTNLSLSFKLILLGALLIRLSYFSVTPPNVRDHDLGDHTDYISYIATHWHPAPIEMATGGAFFHPPFYYYTGAFVYSVADFFFPCNKVQIYRIEQLLSLVYSMGFVFFGLLIIQNLLRLYRRSPLGETIKIFSLNDWRNAYAQNGIFWIIGSLFAFWPSAIIHSTRIGNDPLLYCLLTASLYYTLLWYQSNLSKHLIIASIIGALSIVTKANGEIIIATIAVIGLYKMIKSKEYKYYFKTAIIPCLVLFSAFAITVAPGFILKLQGKREQLYVDNISGLSSANIVGNTSANYFWFDAKIFITEPFTSPYDDRMGRQYFWNYLGKTGLIGEFTYTGIQCINMAVISSFLFVVMLILNLIGLFHLRKIDYKRLCPVFLAGFFLWAGVTYMRMTFPANIDFRYILPITISFAALYGVTLINLNDRGATRVAAAGKVVAVLFSVCSVFFILGIQTA